MSILGTLDSIALKAATITGIKACYTATGSGVSSTSRPIPPALEDGPVGVVWLGSGSVQGGNAETVNFAPTCDVWVPSTEAGAAYKALSAMPDRFIAEFRTDHNLDGQVTRCLVAGWEEPAAEVDVNGAHYLVLSIVFDVLINNFQHDYTVTGEL